MARSGMGFVIMYAGLGALGCLGLYAWARTLDSEDAARMSKHVAAVLPWHHSPTEAASPLIDDPAVVQRATPETVTRNGRLPSPPGERSHSAPTPVGHPQTTEERAALPSEPMEPPPPPRAPAPSDVAPTVHWGVTTNVETRVYLPSGEFQGRIPAATVVEVLRIIHSEAQGELAAFRMLRGEEWLGPFLARAQDIDLAIGPYGDASPEAKALRKERAALIGELGRLRQARRDEMDRANPHFTNYRQAREAYAAHVESAASLQAELEAAQPGRRAEILNLLRQMQVDGARLRTTYETARQRSEQWRAAHASRPQGDPVERRLLSQITELSDRMSATRQ